MLWLRWEGRKSQSSRLTCARGEKQGFAPDSAGLLYFCLYCIITVTSSCWDFSQIYWKELKLGCFCIIECINRRQWIKPAVAGRCLSSPSHSSGGGSTPPRKEYHSAGVAEIQSLNIWASVAWCMDSGGAVPPFVMANTAFMYVGDNWNCQWIENAAEVFWAMMQLCCIVPVAFTYSSAVWAGGVALLFIRNKCMHRVPMLSLNFVWILSSIPEVASAECKGFIFLSSGWLNCAHSWLRRCVI